MLGIITDALSGEDALIAKYKLTERDLRIAARDLAVEQFEAQSAHLYSVKRAKEILGEVRDHAFYMTDRDCLRKREYVRQAVKTARKSAKQNVPA